MAVMTGFSQLSGVYQRMASGLAALQLSTLREAVLIVEGSVAAASGGYRGRRIVATRSYVAGTTALVRMTSRKAHLLDHDTKAHPIGPKRFGVMDGPLLEHPLSGVVHHPGTRGKMMWERGVAAAVPLIGGLMLAEAPSWDVRTTRSAFTKAFG